MASYCGVNPHFEATFTTRTTSPAFSARVAVLPSIFSKGMSARVVMAVVLLARGRRLPGAQALRDEDDALAGRGGRRPGRLDLGQRHRHGIDGERAGGQGVEQGGKGGQVAGGRDR